MIMDSAVINAILERIELGYAKEDIIKELMDVGYPAETALDVYEKVLAMTTVLVDTRDQKATVDSPTVQTEEVSNWGDSDLREKVKEVEVLPVTVPTVSATPPAPVSTEQIIVEEPKKKSALGKVLIIIFIILLLLGGGLAYGMWAGVFNISLLSSAPYKTEYAMMEGLVKNLSKQNAYGFNYDYEIALEAKQPDTKTLSAFALSNPELKKMEESLKLSAVEAKAHLTLSGQVDKRDLNNIKFDSSGTLQIIAEPIFINTGASFRMVDGALYGRLDSIPVNLKDYLQGLPLEQWLLIYHPSWESDDLPIDLLPPIKSQQTYIGTTTQQVAGLVWEDLAKIVTIDPNEFIQTTNQFYGQLASGISAFGLQTGISPEEAKILERSRALLLEYPLFNFVGKPVKEDLKGEKTYRYSVVLNYDNLKKYILQLVAEAEAIDGQILPMTPDELLATLPEKEVFDEFNRLFETFLWFRNDGTLSTVSTKGKFSFDHPDIANQVRFEMTLNTTRQNDALEILVPEDISEKTLRDIFADNFFGGVEISDSVNRQLLGQVRSLGELSANKNKDSYDQVCVDEDVRAVFKKVVEQYKVAPRALRDSPSEAGVIVCNDSSKGYAIMFPLVSDPDFAWCLDSTGFMEDKVASTTLKSGTDITCK